MLPAEPSGLASGRGNRSPNLGASAQPVGAANCGEADLALRAELGVRGRHMHAARDVARLIALLGSEPVLGRGRSRSQVAVLLYAHDLPGGLAHKGCALVD